MAEAETLNELYDKDAYQKGFDAEVLACEQGKNGWEVVLSQTCFYPEGGGQPGDTGKLGDVKVKDTHTKHGNVVHYTDKPLTVGETVHGVIDWRNRFDNMQNHSGEHILSGFVHAKYKYDNVGFHMGADVVTIDFSGPLTWEQLTEMEQKANAYICEDHPVNILLPTKEECAALDYRSKIDIQGQVRVVEFPGADLCACCGTHVHRTGEIGLIKCISLAKHKGGVRIEMLCGRKALAYVEKMTDLMTEVARKFSTLPQDVPHALAKQEEEIRGLKDQSRKAWQAYFSMLAEQTPEGAPIIRFEQDLESVVLRQACETLADAGHSCAILTGVDGNYHYVLASRTIDLRAASKELNKALNGRGGGKPEMVQGTFRASKDEVETALKDALK